MSLAAPRVAVFTAVVVAALVGVAALPSPLPEDVAIERATGRAVSTPAHTLATLRRQGALEAFSAGLAPLPASPLVAGLSALAASESAPPDFAGDTQVTAPVESLFAGVDGAAGLDARAAHVQRRLADGARPPVAELLALAQAFRARGRLRAEQRWLERAIALAPASTLAADRLLAVLLANGRLDPALALVESQAVQRHGDAAWQRHRADLGAWLGRAEVEIAARERLCALAGDADASADRSRLIALYAHVGTPDRALPHAVALVDGAAEVAAAEAGADPVLRSGLADEGLAMLQRAADRAAAPAPWLQRFAALARQDLRIDTAVTALARAAAVDPLAADAALEELYRRTDQPERLADLLQRRLARAPQDRATWQELLTLRHALGQRDAAQALAVQRDLALADPERFVAELPAADRAGAGTLREQALSLTLGPDAPSGVVGETLERLRPFLAQPGFRALAESLLARYPDDPRAKAMRIELVDRDRSPAEAERAAAALAATYPDDVALARLWLQRAQWADAASAQVAARQRVLALDPADIGNRHELADLLEFVGERDAALAHWRDLAAAEGISSPAVPRLIAALHAAGDTEGAVDWLHRLARDEHATREQRLLAAEELFDRQRHGEAKVLFEAVLREAADDAQAMLRLGQIALAAGDARGAVAWFERRLAAAPGDAGTVRFQLGEAQWQLGERAAAAATHEQALRELAAAPMDEAARHAVAVVLDRLGRGEAASAAYRELLARRPRDAELALDWADLQMRRGDLAAARLLLTHAEVVAPGAARTARLRSEVALRGGDVAGAEQALRDAKERGLADAQIDADLAWLRWDRGDWAGAAEAVAAWRAAAPADPAAARLDWQLQELLADHATLRGTLRRIGRERRSELAIGGVVATSERSWLQAEVAHVDLRGATSLAAGGVVATDFARLVASLGWRHGAGERFHVGFTAAPDAPGDTAIGLHAAASWRWAGGVGLEVRGRWHDVWDEPAAAAALGGRVDALDVDGQVQLGAHTWASGGLGVARFALDEALGGGRDDVQVHGELGIGWRWLEGDHAVASWFAPHQLPAGPESPFLAREPDAARPWAGELTVNWRSAELLGEPALTAVLPFAERDEQLTAGVRVDRQLARGLGAALTAYAGLDLRDGDPVHGVQAACTWRPSFGTELTLAAGRGTTFGRSGEDDVEELRFQVVLRW